MAKNKEKTYWPHMIVGFLLLALTLSFWTVKSASSLPVQESNNFLMKYQQADIHINDILQSKADFDALYAIELTGVETMVVSDNIHSKLPQPNSVKLSEGSNQFAYEIKTKDGSVVSDANVTFLLTRPHSRRDDILQENVSFEAGKYMTEPLEITKEGRYTLQISAKVGNAKGYSDLAAYLKLTK